MAARTIRSDDHDGGGGGGGDERFFDSTSRPFTSERATHAIIIILPVSTDIYHGERAVSARDRAIKEK